MSWTELDDIALHLELLQHDLQQMLNQLAEMSQRYGGHQGGPSTSPDAT